MRILKENLETALNIAIQSLEKDERLKKTGFTQGLRAVLDASLKGEKIEIVERI